MRARQRHCKFTGSSKKAKLQSEKSKIAKLYLKKRNLAHVSNPSWLSYTADTYFHPFVFVNKYERQPKIFCSQSQKGAFLVYYFHVFVFAFVNVKDKYEKNAKYTGKSSGPTISNHETGKKAYLIFVIFFTLAYFKAWKFYTQKCVNSRQKQSRDKTA